MAARIRDDLNDLGDLDVLDGLVQVSFDVIAILSQVAAAHDLSLTQLRVLAILRDREPKMAELAAHLGLERSTVSGLVDRAGARGLVRRTTSGDDARVVRVSLSAKGKRLGVKLAGEVSRLVQPMTERLTGAERRVLAGLLGRLLA
jgi:DNA-binding MarR family transcriptional regulator